MRSSESQANIAPALVAAINAIEGVGKTGRSNFGAHATLQGAIEAAHEALVANDLCVMQGPGPLDGNALTLTTRLIHKSGEWIETDFSLPMKGSDPQAAGSAVTYARRYSLMAMLNMPAVDDDGDAAMKHKPDKPDKPKRDTGPSPVDGKDFWKCSGPGMTAHAANAAGLDGTHEAMRAEIPKLATAEEWKAWCINNYEEINKMPLSWRMLLREDAEEQGRFLGAITD